MATYNVETAKHQSLVVLTVDTINLSKSYSAVRVSNHGTTNSIYARVDGTSPTDAGDDTYIIRPGQNKEILVPASELISVQLISPGAMGYSVEGV